MRKTCSALFVILFMLLLCFAMCGGVCAENASVTITAHKIHADTEYLGTETTVKIAHPASVAKLVAEYRCGNALIGTLTSEESSRWASGVCKIPLTVKIGTLPEKAQWTYEGRTLRSGQKPNRVKITAYTKNGEEFSGEYRELDETCAAWRDLCRNNFYRIGGAAGQFVPVETAQGKGLETTFTLTNPDYVREISAEVYRGKKILAKASAEVSKLRPENGSYAICFPTVGSFTNSGWEMGTPTLTKDDIPIRVVFTIKDVFGDTKTFSSARLPKTSKEDWNNMFTKIAVSDISAGIDSEKSPASLKIAFCAENLANCKNISVILTRGSKELSRATSKGGAKDGTTEVCFGTVQEARSSEDLWEYTGNLEDQKPTKVTVLAEDKNGTILTKSISFPQEARADWEKLFENETEDDEVIATDLTMRTHIGKDYTGIEASWNLKNAKNVIKMQIDLYSGEEIIATNKTEGKRFKYQDDGMCSVPFYVQRGTFVLGSNKLWHFTKNLLSINKVPTKVVLTIRTSHKNTICLEQTVLQRDDGDWGKLFEIPEMTADVSWDAKPFTMHVGEDYKGIVTRFRLTDTESIKNVKAVIYSESGTKPIFECTAKIEALHLRGDGTYELIYGKDKKLTDTTLWKREKHMVNKNYQPTKVTVTIEDFYGNTKMIQCATLENAIVPWNQLYWKAK